MPASSRSASRPSLAHSRRPPRQSASEGSTWPPGCSHLPSLACKIKTVPRGRQDESAAVKWRAGILAKGELAGVGSRACARGSARRGPGAVGAELCRRSPLPLMGTWIHAPWLRRSFSPGRFCGGPLASEQHSKRQWIRTSRWLRPAARHASGHARQHAGGGPPAATALRRHASGAVRRVVALPAAGLPALRPSRRHAPWPGGPPGAVPGGPPGGGPPGATVRLPGAAQPPGEYWRFGPAAAEGGGALIAVFAVVGLVVLAGLGVGAWLLRRRRHDWWPTHLPAECGRWCIDIGG